MQLVIYIQTGIVQGRADNGIGSNGEVIAFFDLNKAQPWFGFIGSS